MKSLWWIAAIVAALLIGVGVLGLSNMGRMGYSRTGSGADTVAVSLREFKIAASQTTFKVGRTYTFAATNDGKLEHELVLEPDGAVDQALTAGGKVAEADDIAPGQTKTLTWTFTAPGRYQLACHKPGHFQRGMVFAPILVTA